MDALFNIAAAIALVGILIFIHEFGHFFFAKLFGVGVREFSLGFGKRLFGVKLGGTDYKVCLFPIGGYVLMEGADPFLDQEEQAEEANVEGSLLNKPVWQRLIIVAAGPFANLLLPVVVLTGLYMAGDPQPISVVGSVMHGSPADVAGIEAGDQVQSVAGDNTPFWFDIYGAMETASVQDPLLINVVRDGESFDLEIPVPAVESGLALPWHPSEVGLSNLHPAPIVGVSDPSSPAGQVGIQTFDTIVSVGGEPVRSFADLMSGLTESGREATIEWLSDGELRTGTIVGAPAEPSENTLLDRPLANPWGLYPATLFVESVQEDSAAEEAGIVRGDRLVAIDEVALRTWGEVTSTIGSKQVGTGEGSSAVAVSVTVARDGAERSLELLPRVVRDTDMLGRYYYRAMIGVGRGGDLVGSEKSPRYYGFSSSVGMAFEETKLLVGLTLTQIGKLLTREAAPSKSLGGPVQIFRDAGAAAEAGPFQWFRMMALLSISLAIVNFLPVPVLDGGQFLFFLVEAIRGRPVSLRFRERAQQVGVLALVALMLMVFVFDINRALGG